MKIIIEVPDDIPAAAALVQAARQSRRAGDNREVYVPGSVYMVIGPDNEPAGQVRYTSRYLRSLTVELGSDSRA